MVGKQFAILLTFVVCANPMFAAPEFASLRLDPTLSLDHHEKVLHAMNSRKQEWPALTNATPRMTCEETVPPEALATPRMFGESKPATKIVVNFVIGTDGRVHNPLILESNDDNRDASALRAIRSWKFRPATCNGVPTEADGTVEFSRR